MVVTPVEPVVFQGRNLFEALALSRSGDGAALKVPFAGGCGVQQKPGGIGFDLRRGRLRLPGGSLPGACRREPGASFGGLLWWKSLRRRRSAVFGSWCGIFQK